VVWEEVTAAGSAVLVRRFTSAGVALSAPYLVDQMPVSSQRNPAVMADEVGDFVVEWNAPSSGGSGLAVLAQELELDANQQPRPLGGQVQLNTTTAGDQELAVVSGGGGGDLFSVWQSVAPGATGAVVTGLVARVPALSFYTLSPCRLVDTREAAGPLGGPSLVSGAVRNFPLLSAGCGLPDTAKAVSLNVTVVSPSNGGNVAAYPGDGPVPTSSVINFNAGQTIANNCVIGLSRAGDGSLNVRAYVVGPGTTDFLIDINGYFQ
jgi:hypothetical protein